MFFILAIFTILLAVVAGGVLISNVIAWYEAVNRQPALLESGLSGGQLRFAGGLLTTETLLLFLTLLLRPLGWGEPRRAKPHYPNSSAAGTPVLLLHGLFHNRGCWWWIRRRLRKRGVPVFTLNLPLWRRNIPSIAARVAKKIDEIRISSGVEKVHLVGHSMGGLVALHYLQNNGADKVDRCVLLGTPVGGSKMAALAISPMGRGLLPGSILLKDLFRSRLPEQVRVTAIYSRHDNLILPPENARLDGGGNIELDGVQHTSLLYHPRAVKALISALMETS